MLAPTLTNTSCRLDEQNLEQFLTLKRKISEKSPGLFETNQY